MPINNAEYIAELNSNDPAYNDRVREAAGHIRSIKKSLVQTFPSYDEAIDVGPDELNGFEARIAAIEATYAGEVLRKSMSGRIAIDGSGDYAVTGIGFTPSIIIAVATFLDPTYEFHGSNGSWGVADASNNFCVSLTRHGLSGVDRTYADFTLLWQTYEGRGFASHHGTLKSFDADGFTVTEEQGNFVHDLTWVVFE